ncbi:porin family protein [Pedobacter sp. PAMC26386]|nr:porin family protein [Pedobacter sp. PAMC26386]
MKRIITLNLALLLACGFSIAAQAQESTKPLEKEPLYNFSPAFDFLRSTHGNFFNGPSLKVTRNFLGNFKPGIGIGYATTSRHPDNGYILYKMKMLPVYANLTYEIPTKSKFEPFAETSIGISFVKYDRATDAEPLVTTRINETGLYVYGGFGVRYAVTKHIAPYIATGFKGYHMSTNDLDINPHGITFQVGVRF